MNVFVAGATGTLGLPLVRALAVRNHEVVGLTRSPENRRRLELVGVKPVVADALDAQAVEHAVRSAAPECIVHLLTAIPKNGPLRASDMNATNQLRVAGTTNLLRAGIRAGAKRIVGESMTFAYGLGDHGHVPKVESDPLQPREAKAWLQPIVDGIRSLEEQLLAANQQGLIEAIPLRYGFLYGAENPSTRHLLQMVSRRLLPAVSGSGGMGSWIHVSDAVEATIAAIERGRAGDVYNVVDEEPVGFSDWITHAASVLGAKPPFRLPIGLLRWMMPYAAAAVFETRLRVSNGKAKQELQWRPAFPTYREGLQQVATELNAN